jgi:hypothetical protein
MTQERTFTRVLSAVMGAWNQIIGTRFTNASRAYMVTASMMGYQRLQDQVQGEHSRS